MLKILFLAANPSNTNQLQLDEEVRAIDGALRKAKYREHFELETHWAVRIDDLQELLLRYQPHIVHFSGHGSATSEIMLQDLNGQSISVPTTALSMLFGTLKDNIRCVILNCCYSVIQAEAIAQHIDCVVGISDVITDVASRYFASSFYQALAYGRTIEESHALGTVQLMLYGLVEEHKPQLLGASDPKSVYLVNPDKVNKAKLIDPDILSLRDLALFLNEWKIIHTTSQDLLLSLDTIGKLIHRLSKSKLERDANELETAWLRYCQRKANKIYTQVLSLKLVKSDELMELLPLLDGEKSMIATIQHLDANDSKGIKKVVGIHGALLDILCDLLRKADYEIIKIAEHISLVGNTYKYI